MAGRGEGREEARRRALRAALAVTLTVAGAGCSGESLGIDTDPCAGSILYRSKSGCSCQVSGGSWDRTWLRFGECTHGLVVPGPFVPPDLPA